MNLNLSFLNSFLAVASAGSFTAAAQELFITQPAVSQHIHALEEELGVRLFIRKGRGAVLTEEGLVLREKTQELMQTLEDVRTSIQDRNELKRGKIRLAVTELLIYLLPPVLLEFKKRYPGVEVELLCDNTPTVVRMVAEGNVDFALARVVFSLSQRLESRLVHMDKLVLVAPAWHPLAESGMVTAQALRGETLALRERGAYTRECAITWFKGHELPASTIETNTMAGMREMVLNGCVAFLPEGVVQQDIKNGRLASLAASACKVNMEYHFYARKGDPLSRATTVFLELLAHSGQLSHGHALPGAAHAKNPSSNRTAQP